MSSFRWLCRLGEEKKWVWLEPEWFIVVTQLSIARVLWRKKNYAAGLLLIRFIWGQAWFQNHSVIMWASTSGISEAIVKTIFKNANCVLYWSQEKYSAIRHWKQLRPFTKTINKLTSLGGNMKQKLVDTIYRTSITSKCHSKLFSCSKCLFSRGFSKFRGPRGLRVRRIGMSNTVEENWTT